MTTKTDPTNEQVAEALGWRLYLKVTVRGERAESASRFSYWVDNESIKHKELPDFTHDLNASWKYVWPEIVKLNEQKNGINYFTQNYDDLSGFSFGALMSPNPAMYLAIKLIALKEE